MDPISGSLLAASVGMSAYGMFGPKSKPDYSGVTNQYNQRQSQIGEFAKSLASSRAKYLTSLNRMYNNAYARFSGNAEAGFANRGLAVNGGAFASALARKTAEYSDAGATAEAGMEREDLRSVDGAYGANSNGYMSAISGGPAMQFGADRQDSAALGGFLSKLTDVSMETGGFGYDSGPTKYSTDYSEPMTHDNIKTGYVARGGGMKWDQ